MKRENTDNDGDTEVYMQKKVLINNNNINAYILRSNYKDFAGKRN